MCAGVRVCMYVQIQDFWKFNLVVFGGLIKQNTGPPLLSYHVSANVHVSSNN